ncbi:TonB-dependent receptor [Caulobacter sp. 17J65-9]|uniref:TonB-dependent receptor domain-containing protein n=1 Tax=Caulobacter sp. 17J65-9 TaxID=2709382 RepID=UPI001969E525|nr:TonB-dependent receptor [Caulobacter sp. 17J65-9]
MQPLQRVLLGGASCAVLATMVTFAPSFAWAQDPNQEPPAAQEEPGGEVEEIVVTGSRIPRKNLTSVSPVTTLGQEEIELTGTTRIEDLVNQLPQAFANQGGSISNDATGTATVDLRNLGPTRTLVLVDGRRLPGGTPGGTSAEDIAPDLNQIPAQLVKRIEVVTGGASAVYGSDAVAGVVNFIMNDSFEGLQLDAQYDWYQHNNDNGIQGLLRDSDVPVPGDRSDGATTNLTGIMGIRSNDGRGSMQLYAGYRNVEAITQANRDFSSCALGTNDAGTAFTCAGSATSVPGFFQPVDAATSLPVGDPLTIDSATGNTFRPFDFDTDLFNFQPLNFFQRPDTRYTFGGFGSYTVNDQAEVYAQLMFMDDHTQAQVAPSGLFISQFAVPCDNPLLSADQVAAMCTATGVVDTDPLAPGNQGLAQVQIGRRNVEGGGRLDDLRHTSYRGVVGVRGDLNPDWNYDIYAQYGSVVFAENFRNDFSLSRSRRALDVVADPITGAPVCRSVLDGSDPACVPYNIFQTGGVTQAALDYLQVPGFQEGSTTQQVINASISGDLTALGVKFPWATGGVQVAFGTEYRYEAMDLKTDAAFTSGDLTGQGGPVIGVSGSFDVYDLFFEATVPIMEEQPWAQELSLDLGYRWSNYSTGINTDTYKIGPNWAPTQDFRLRASYQRAVRAPNVRELFATQAVGLFDMNSDPCAGATPTFTLAQCVNTGVTAAQYGLIADNPAGQFNALFGGTSNLGPESSDTWSAGIVFTPSFLPGLNGSIDWFDIDVDGVIGFVAPDLALRQCGLTGDAFFCDRINRGAGGSLWVDPNGFVSAVNENLGSIKTSGVDVNVNYRFDLDTIWEGGPGDVTINFVGTWLDKFEVEPVPGLGTYDCAGLYGPTCGAPLPEWRNKLWIVWNTPWNVDASLSWRYIGEVTLDGLDNNPLLNDPNAPTVDRKLDSQNYIDIAGSWDVEDNFTLRFGVNNLFDQDPPISSSVGVGSGNGNTFPQVYDALGRHFFIGLTANF